MNHGARGGERLCGRIRASETKHLVALANELLDDGGSDESRRTRDEYAQIAYSELDLMAMIALGVCLCRVHFLFVEIPGTHNCGDVDELAQEFLDMAVGRLGKSLIARR
jgi:hypothetical protein